MEPAHEVLAAVVRAIGPLPRPLQRPVLLETDARCVAIAMKRDPLDGTEIDLFEDDLAALTGARFAVALNSGTAALQLGLIAAGVEPGDEVLTPSLSFVATGNAILHAGAVPHFIDSRSLDMGAHPFKLRQYLGGGIFERREGGLYNLRTDRRIAACMPVHLLGGVAEVSGVKSICDAYGIAVVEDSCEALGSVHWTGKWCGTFGIAGAFSFNLNKIVTTGGGGAIVTDNEIIASTVRHLATQAKVKHPYRWDHDAIGYNYRMPNVCAAMGISQLRRFRKTLEAKETLWNKYLLSFSDCKSAKLINVPGNHWLNACILDPHHLNARDSVIETLQSRGYGARALFTPMHRFPFMEKFPRQSSLESADDLHRRVICLPSSLEACDDLGLDRGHNL